MHATPSGRVGWVSVVREKPNRAVEITWGSPTRRGRGMTMAGYEVDADLDANERPSGLTRRNLIKRGAVLGGVAVWAAPLVKLALTDAGDKQAQTLGNAQLVAFEAPCGSVNLASPTYTLTVCAKNVNGARSAFTSAATTACATKCGQLGPCTGTCRKPAGKAGKPSIGAVTCTGPGADCPSPPYGGGTKEWICSAVVTCPCACA